MAEPNSERIEHLEHAFLTFNELSEQLMSSYRHLEAQVDRLSKELVVAHDERSEQFNKTKHLANRLERLLDALPGGVVVLDGRGIVQETNPAAIDLLGEPLKGMPWREIIQRAFSPCFDDGHDVSLQDGRRVNISTSSLGKEPGQILLIKDVTETRQLQDKLSRYQRLSAMGQMAASLAHQVRTPTASALLYVSNLCHENVKSADSQKYGEKIRSQLRHIESMISDMLMFAKDGADNYEESFSVDVLVEELSQSLAAQAQIKDCQLDFANKLSGYCFKGNKDALHGALSNIVMNALYARSDNKPRVCVSVRYLKDGNAEIAIKDNGTGIPEAIKSQIFEPFISSRPQGTGLGLAVVKSVIEKHGGEIEFSSEKNKGTEFRIYLPVYTFKQVNEKDKKIKSEVNNEVVI
jgi:two-component system sensor histidine kinase FlrB